MADYLVAMKGEHWALTWDMQMEYQWVRRSADPLADLLADPWAAQMAVPMALLSDASSAAQKEPQRDRR